MTCQAFLFKGGFTEASLQNTMEGLKAKLADDVETAAELMQVRKRPASQSASAPASKQIKKEIQLDSRPLSVKVKQEIDPDAVVKKEIVPAPVASHATCDNVPEVSMSKSALIKLHQLQVLPKNTSNKVNPVYCQWCDKTFEGRNAPKVLQHVKGAGHRSLWKQGTSSDLKTFSMDPVQPQSGLGTKTLGKCLGLRLGSSMGAETRLGGDLRQVWSVYTKYAFLERTRLMANHCLCNNV